MVRKTLLTFGLALALSSASVVPAFAETASVTMENSGAYLFEWRPVDYGNGRSFAILVGGNTIAESDVILNRGYDYAYTFFPNQYGRPWGTVPDLVNVDGVWGIPENWASLPEGAQPTLQIVLYTNRGNTSTKERYIDVVHLPSGVDTASLPAEVRKYLISTDGSDIGAYNGTITAGWVTEDGKQRYRKIDGTYVTNSWLTVDDQTYYVDENGYKLTDTITPDGIYVNSNGEKTNYIPGWTQAADGRWRYVQKNGYYAASTWITDTDGKSYYFDMAGYMVTNETTPDGYYVGADGVWDGNASTAVNQTNPGPGAQAASAGWVEIAGSWKYVDENGEYAVSCWRQSADGGWYYLGADGVMVTSQTTPDGYVVDENGRWNG